jgi:hypothetical protein
MRIRGLDAVVTATVLCSALLAVPGHARQASVGGSKGSVEGSELGSALIVEGSAELIKAGAQFTVTAIEPSVNAGKHLITITTTVAKAGSAVAEEVGVVTLEVASGLVQAAVESGKATSELASTAGEELLLAVGDILTVVVTPIGYSLVVSGYVIAYFANELGEILIHHSIHD